MPVIIIAVGGPSCSGKTTLAKHLLRILPNSSILHQDDFAPPSELIPIHPTLGVQDWDHPEGAIEWPRMRNVLKYIKEHNGTFPPEHSSHDFMNAQVPVHIDEDIAKRWKSKFSDFHIPSSETEEMVYVIADGFLLYWDEECRKSYDVQFFVRESENVLRKRREERQGYHTAEGLMWKDPPNYWQQIVWPSYIYAHQHLFTDGNVESGSIKPNEDVVLLESGGELGEKGMDRMVEKSCQHIWKVIGGH